MALSSLTSLTEEQYRALNITPFPIPPGVSSTGDPDNRISIQLGGWVGTDVLAFTVTNQANASSDLNIDSTATNTVDANVNPGISPTAQSSYWTINMGSNASSSNWEISVEVDANNRNTGSWKFVKGKTVDPK